MNRVLHESAHLARQLARCGHFAVLLAAGRTRLVLRPPPHAGDLALEPVSGLLDARHIPLLAPWTRDMGGFRPELRAMLREHREVRAWEYGWLLHGLPLRSSRVLDVGCGPSFFPGYLRRRLGAQVTVLDLPQPYTVESRVLAERCQRYGIELRTGDMRHMPLDDGQFDVVLSISVIEHLSHDPGHTCLTPREQFYEQTRRTLAEMARVLRPGGWLYLTSDAYLSGRVDFDAWTGRACAGEPYGAYPLEDLHELFPATVQSLGLELPYPVRYDQQLLVESAERSSYRHRYMTIFNLFARKPAGASG